MNPVRSCASSRKENQSSPASNGMKQLARLVVFTLFSLSFVLLFVTPTSLVHAQNPLQHNVTPNVPRDLRDEATRQAVENASNKGTSGVGLDQCLPIPSWWNGHGCLAAVMNFFIELFSYLLILAAAAFDFVLKFTIIDFSNYVKGELGQAIDTVWILLKNLSNLIFIFVLLYIALKTIAQGNGFTDKKLLLSVIVMAILINFSLFFTKLAIDMSNFVTIEIYNGITASTAGQRNDASFAIKNPSGGGPTYTTGSLSGNVDNGLSSAFLNSMRITSVYGNEGQVINAGNILTNGIVAVILILVATFVFASAAAMFLYRFLAFVILMMTSPIAFVGSLLPNASSAASKWRQSLIDNCVFAPAFMIMVYISLQLLVFTTTALRGNTSVVGTLMNYGITIAAMIGSLVIAKSVGKSVGGAKIGGNVAKWVAGNTYGAAARGGIGQSARKLSEGLKNTRFGNYAIVDKINKGTLGAVTGARFGSSASAVEKAKEKKEYAGRRQEIQTQVDTRAALKRREVGALSRLNNNQLLGMGADTLKQKEVAENLSASQLEAVMKADKEKFSDGDKQAILAARFNKLEDKAVKNTDQDDTEFDDARDKSVKDEIGKLSDKELEYVPSAVVANTAFKRSLTTKQVDILVKNGKLTGEEGTRLKKNKTQKLEAAIAATPPDVAAIRTALGKLTTTDISQLHKKDILMKDVVIPLLPISVLNKIKDDLSQAQKASVSSLVTDPAVAAWIADPDNGFN